MRHLADKTRNRLLSAYTAQSRELGTNEGGGEWRGVDLTFQFRMERAISIFNPPPPGVEKNLAFLPVDNFQSTPLIEFLSLHGGKENWSFSACKAGRLQPWVGRKVSWSDVALHKNIFYTWRTRFTSEPIKNSLFVQWWNVLLKYKTQFLFLNVY